MTELGLRPRSATELVDAAFQVFRRDPMAFIVASAVFYVPWLLVRVALSLDTPAANGELDMSLLVALSSVFSLFVYAAASAIVMLIARDVYLDRPVDVPGSFRAIVPKLFSLVTASFVTGFLFVLGFILLIVPGFYVLARLFAVQQAIVFEGAGVGRALSRSSELSVGVKRHVLAALVLTGLIVFAVSIGSVMLSSIVPSRVVLFAVSTVVSVIVYPFVAIVQTLLYYDVRIRKEGFDIEYLAGGAPLDAVGGTAA